MASSQASVEQVALRHLLDNAYEDFKQSLHSAAARFVLWGSFKDSDELVNHYFSAKSRKDLTDGRRSSKSLTEQEMAFRNSVEIGAFEAFQYVSWARKHGGQPILREMLIAYCTAFENCLKNIALVFALANIKKHGIEDQVFVPSEQFRKTLGDIK